MMDDYTEWQDAEADHALGIAVALFIFALCAIAGVAIVWVQS